MEPLGNEEFDFSALHVAELTPDEAARIGVQLDPPPVNGQDVTADARTVDEPDPKHIRAPRRPNGAAHYEDQLAGINRAAIKSLAKHRETLPDAAILLLQGPEFCKAWGNAAADNDRIAAALEWLAAPTDNPLLLAIGATMPIVLQMFRNHEPVLQPKPRGFRIPFMKDVDGNPRTVRLPKLGIRLQNVPGYAAATNDPDSLVRHVFGNRNVQAELRKQGIDVAQFVPTN